MVFEHVGAEEPVQLRCDAGAGRGHDEQGVSGLLFGDKDDVAGLSRFHGVHRGRVIQAVFGPVGDVDPVHTGRVRSEAAFAALAGTYPVPASSGGTTRFRLNRGGDRQLNKAIYTIALIRMNRDPDTKNYVTKRTSQGRTKKEIIRSLKRFVLPRRGPFHRRRSH